MIGVSPPSRFPARYKLPNHLFDHIVWIDSHHGHYHGWATSPLLWSSPHNVTISHLSNFVLFEGRYSIKQKNLHRFLLMFQNDTYDTTFYRTVRGISPSCKTQPALQSACYKGYLSLFRLLVNSCASSSTHAQKMAPTESLTISRLFSLPARIWMLGFELFAHSWW